MLLLLRACMFTQTTEPVVIHRGFIHSIWGRACFCISYLRALRALRALRTYSSDLLALW
jgi:membrane-bound metal-dependent hydrolase YbcI (DUF457 family)